MVETDFRVLLVYPNEAWVGVVPSNLALLSACLKKAGFLVKLFDASIYRRNRTTQDNVRAKLNQVKQTEVEKYYQFKDEDVMEAFCQEVDAFQPRVIALPLVDGVVNFGISLLEKIKDKNIVPLVGGVTATFTPEKLMNHSTLIRNVCVGEGEEAIVEFCERVRDGKDYTDVRNFYFRMPDGTIKKNLLRPPVDLNTLPYPDFSIYEDFRLYRPFQGKVVRMVQIDIDRGCPYNCSFCAAPVLRELYKKESGHNYFRHKTIDRIIEETKYLVKTYQLNFLWFSSETFFARNIEHLQKFADRYVKEIDLPFWCQTRLDTFNEKTTPLLEKMGCKAVAVGMEHGNDKFRNEVLIKQLDTSRILESFRVLAKHNIFVTVNSMIGLPGETREDIFDTIELNRKVTEILSGNHSNNVFIFMPFSGTPLRALCLERGYISEDDEVPFSFFEESILDMPQLSKEEIRGLEKTIPLYIRLPKSYWPQIKVAEREDEEGRAMFEKLTGILQKEFSK